MDGVPMSGIRFADPISNLWVGRGGFTAGAGLLMRRECPTIHFNIYAQPLRQPPGALPHYLVVVLAEQAASQWR